MGRSIVVVEDESILRRLIARNLEARGHTVRQAGTAAEGVGVLLRRPPDLLLLDINLPDGSGWDVLREMERHGIEVPTVVMSASRISPSLLDEFRPLACLPKPFALDSLLELVRGDFLPVARRTAALCPRQRV